VRIRHEKHGSPDMREPCGLRPCHRTPVSGATVCVLRPGAEWTGRANGRFEAPVAALLASCCALTTRRQAVMYRVAEEDSHWPTLTAEACCWLRTRTPR
jgi:hypothetical protein